MTSISKQQLSILCAATVVGGALLWNGGALRAQDFDEHPTSSLGENPRKKLTRDEAAKSFSVSMNALAHREAYTYQDSNLENSVSLKSQREIGRESGVRRSVGLFVAMILQWKQPNQTIRLQSEGNKTATVVVEEDPTPPARPLVLIEENGGWGVDLVETYAKWNNLQGTAKAEAIYKLTGVILEGLPRTEQLTRRACQSNLKQIALGIAQYTQDYDEKYPLAKPWIDIVQPYVKSEAIFNCPSIPKGKRYGYAYNSKLSNKPGQAIFSISQTVSVYETSVLKRNAYGIGENPAFRHFGGANYAFADGHVKWMAKSRIPSFKLKP